MCWGGRSTAASPILRKVDFTTGGQNFVLVLSPGLIDKAPHAFLATVRVGRTRGKRHVHGGHRPLPQHLHRAGEGRHRPGETLLQQLAAGVGAASLVTILAGLLVLAGAIAAGSRARLYDATVLKVLGATRSQIASIYVIEYGVLGILTGILALGVGTFAADLICREVLEVSLNFDFGVAALTVLGGGAATLVFGLAGAWTALSARPAAQLRSP